jgi:hypothetical protein
MAQVESLARTLEERPSLGAFVRRLRADWNFGTPLNMLLHATPNIELIALSNLAIPMNDHSQLMYSALEGMNPRKLALISNSWLEEIMAHPHTSASLQAVAPKWTNLVRRASQLWQNHCLTN